MRSTLATLFVLIGGLLTLFWSTDGLRAFTTEGARRLAVAENPRPVPDVTVEDQAGRRSRLSDWRGKPVVVDFIYTGCETYCVVLSSGMKRLQQTLEKGQGEVMLLSVSFDPLRDTPERMTYYASRLGADPVRWTFARVVDPHDLDPLLQAFGITVIPDGLGGFEHNAALHVIDSEGRLAGIFDYDNPSSVATYLGF